MTHTGELTELRVHSLIGNCGQDRAAKADSGSLKTSIPHWYKVGLTKPD